MVTGGFSSQGVSSAEPCCFLSCVPVLSVDQAIELPVVMQSTDACVMPLMW